MAFDELALFGGPKTLSAAGPHHPWPIITDRLRQAVLRQLEESVSIYNRSGIIERFESLFSSYHGRRYAVLCNSGTSAIWSMYEGIGLGPGDEVIVPTYTFFATVTPLMMTGARPVFVDSLPDGNISPAGIRQRLTSATRAVVVTHMWGIPCEMEEINEICKKHSLHLLEDCSHAHGATYHGRKVGTFGTCAAWSLQGQKTISGGEGGILCTDSDEVYARAQMLGHYNIRCKEEIPREHPLYRFSMTGFGQKLRSHPLAIAIAEEQFQHLEEWLAQRRQYAAEMDSAFADISCLRLPVYTSREPSWYAYVLNYDETQANGVPIETFFAALQAEGLLETNRPAATRPLHDLPLFKEPSAVLGKLYRAEDDEPSSGDYPQAVAFYRSAIKFPVWARGEDRPFVEQYIEGVRKVAHWVANDPGRLIRWRG